MDDNDQNYAILWDMDGVLVNTGEYHYQSWKKTFEGIGLSYSREQFRKTFGMNNAGVLKYILGKKLPHDQEQSIGDQKEILFRDAVRGKARLLPGVKSTLIKFSEWNFKQAIASSAPPKNIDVLVNELKIGQYFDATVSGNDLPGKPDPAIFLRASQLLDVEPERCIVIEDAVAGVAGAKNAGMKCIAVTTTNTIESLTKADLILESLDDLRNNTFLDLFD